MGVSRRKCMRTTQKGQHESSVADLVNRDFTVSATDQFWVADITYVSTWAGFLYLSVFLDAFSRRIGGWAPAFTPSWSWMRWIWPCGSVVPRT